MAAEHLRLARETRGAVVLIAWIITIFAVLAVIGGIVIAVQVHSENQQLQNNSGSTSCVVGVSC